MTPRISDLVSPGLYEGPPWQIIDKKALPREIDPSTPKFRRQRRGVGKCAGSRINALKPAYLRAYVMCEAALQEVRNVMRSPDAQVLWHASRHHPEASLAYWFGADPDGPLLSDMLHEIEAVLREWTLAFCAGFRGLLPVFIRCKSVHPVGKTSVARHLVKNTVELSPGFFNRSRHQQAAILLHEMGHRSTALLRPRDERHALCSGGWNKKNDMCYRDRDAVDGGDRIYKEGNPRDLAVAATDGNASARKTALNNIDNYVCYMWNRDRDHGLNMLQLLPPGTKPPKPGPGQTTPASVPPS